MSELDRELEAMRAEARRKLDAAEQEQRSARPPEILPAGDLARSKASEDEDEDDDDSGPGALLAKVVLGVALVCVLVFTWNHALAPLIRLGATAAAGMFLAWILFKLLGGGKGTGD